LKTDMKKLSILVSLPGENRYLAEQATVAHATAQQLNLDLRVINAHSDPVSQSQQLLEIIQSPPASRPDAIIVEPATESGLPRVAEAAVSAGIGWVVSNARVDYLEQLRRDGKVPVFSISQDHSEIGRLQARQFGALLPEGGTVLYLRGPGTNYLASQRAEGMEAAAPRNVRVKALKIQWTEENCFQSVSSWLRLGTAKAADIGLISSQNTDFVNGARRAFQGVADTAERGKWLALRCTGAGVLSQTKPLVDSGVLAAAVVTSVTMDLALETLVKALQSGSQPTAHTFVSASSYPNLEDLARKHAPRVVATTAKY
jgi:ABC-type sugar transport system substrate-binding protein